MTPCNYATTPTDISSPSTGGTFTVYVNAAEVCSWTTSIGLADPTWLGFLGGGEPSGTGDGQVSIYVTSNQSTSERSGTLFIAGQPLTVTQADALATPSFGLRKR
jgi:hypothetical protein